MLASRAISTSASSQYASPQAVRISSVAASPSTSLNGTQQRLRNGRVVLRQDVQPDMLLRDALHARGERAEVVDVARIGDHGGGERLGLGACLAMVRLVEQVADVWVLEHALVHALRDGDSMRLESRYGRFDEIDGLVAKGGGHRVSLDAGGARYPFRGVPRSLDLRP